MTSARTLDAPGNGWRRAQRRACESSPRFQGECFMRILVAEDECVTRLILQALLRNWGDEAVTVSDGLAAWQLLDSVDAPSLAILDWMMPGLDGLEICQRLRQLQNRPYVYV